MTAIPAHLNPPRSRSRATALKLLTPRRLGRDGRAALDFQVEQLHYNPATGATLRLVLRVAGRRAWRAQSVPEQNAWASWTLPGGLVLAYQLVPVS